MPHRHRTSSSGTFTAGLAAGLLVASVAWLAACGKTAAGSDASWTGHVSVHEARYQAHPELGQGLEVAVDFEPVAQVEAPAWEERPGQPGGCKVFGYDPLAYQALIGGDAGTVSLSAGVDAPATMDCDYSESQGYFCLTALGIGGELAPGPTSTRWRFAGAPVHGTFTVADVGRFIEIHGATTPANDGTFPIVAVDQTGAAPALVIENPAGVAEPLPFAAGWSIVAGLGPVPGIADPGLLPDGTLLSVSLAPIASGPVAAFAAAYSGAGVGDAFTLDTASQALIDALPQDGSAFTIGCSGAGGACGTADRSSLVIVTSDGDPAGLSPVRVPPPATTALVLSCTADGAGAIAVPAGASAYLRDFPWTRARAAFSRPAILVPSGAPAVTIAAGHAVIGVTDRAP